VILEDGESSIIAFFSQSLLDNDRRGTGVDREQPVNFVPEWVQLALSVSRLSG